MQICLIFLSGRPFYISSKPLHCRKKCALDQLRHWNKIINKIIRQGKDLEKNEIMPRVQPDFSLYEVEFAQKITHGETAKAMR